MVLTPAGHVSRGTASQLVPERKGVSAWSLQLHKRSKITFRRLLSIAPDTSQPLGCLLKLKIIAKIFSQLPNQSCSDPIQRHVVDRSMVGGSYSLRRGKSGFCSLGLLARNLHLASGHLAWVLTLVY